MTTDAIIAAVSAIAVATAVGAAVTALRSLSYATRDAARSPEGVEETSEQRVSRLTSSLSEAVRTVEEIQAELREGQEAVERLRGQIETFQRLRDLDQGEVEAVAEVLGLELRKEGRRSAWRDFAFFFAGTVISVLVTLLIG